MGGEDFSARHRVLNLPDLAGIVHSRGGFLQKSFSPENLAGIVRAVWTGCRQRIEVFGKNAVIVLGGQSTVRAPLLAEI